MFVEVKIGCHSAKKDIVCCNECTGLKVIRTRRMRETEDVLKVRQTCLQQCKLSRSLGVC